MGKDKVWHQVTNEGFQQSQSQLFCFPVGFICLSSLKNSYILLYIVHFWLMFLSFLAQSSFLLFSRCLRASSSQIPTPFSHLKAFLAYPPSQRWIFNPVLCLLHNPCLWLWTWNEIFSFFWQSRLTLYQFYTVIIDNICSHLDNDNWWGWWLVVYYSITQW